MNTRFLYRYRDASNNKTICEVIFDGMISQEECHEISEKLITTSDGDILGQFIPGQVGLKDLQNAFYDTPIDMGEKIIACGDEIQNKEEMSDLLADMRATKPIWWPDDDIYHDLLMIDHVERAPTDGRPLPDFIRQFSETDWNDQYLPPFYEEMIENYNDHMRSDNCPCP